MALKLNCILNHSSVLPELVRLVEKTAHSLNSKKKSAKVEDVYREIRDDGIEIDAESIALAYQNVSGIMGRKGFSTQADVRKFGGETLKRAIRIANEGDITKSRLGKASISRAVAGGMATTFSTLEGNNDVDKSRLIQLQEAVRRVANSMLDKSGYKSKPKATFLETLQNLFDVENINATGKEAMNGKVKSTFEKIDAVWDDLKSDLDAISKGIKDKAQRARFDQMTAAVRNSSYDLLLGTKQADDMVKSLLKEAGYVREVNSPNGTVQVVDWNKALANQKDWRDEFGLVLRKGGFDIAQTQRVLDKLEGNYNKAIQKQSENRLNSIKKKNNLPQNVNRDAVNRLIGLKNAGIFAPQNKAYLDEAMGYPVPDEVASKVKDILADYEKNTAKSGNISNVEAEEVRRAISTLLSPLNKAPMENIVGNIADYFALKASSTISTMFNAFQNTTSGINAAVLPSISAIVASKNPKLIGLFLSDWINTARDVTLGGVSPRDAKTVNLNQFENRGGLSDRWTIDSASSFFGYLKASFNILGQVTATAMDAANGTIIYDAEMVKSARAVLKGRGLSNAEANKAVDDIIFGQHSTGISKRAFWKNEALDRLKNQEGVKDRATKAARIASELMWSDLITKYGLTINEVKAMQTASLGQMSKNLGHQSDLKFTPSTLLEAGSSYFNKKAADAKQAEDRGGHASWILAGTMFKAVNMFMGGKINWAILALENTPVGVFIGLTDVISSEIFNKKGSTPVYRQDLAVDDHKALEEQLRTRKGMISRFERGIIGTAIQTTLYLAFVSMMKGGSPDDDRKRLIKAKFDKYMKDPASRRLMDKAAPMILATELQFAYDKKSGTLNRDKISESLLLPYYLTSLSGAFDFGKTNIMPPSSLDFYSRTLEYNKRIGNDDKRFEANAESTAQYVGSLLSIPYTAWWNIEKTEVKLISNGLQPNPSGNSERRRQFMQQKHNIDGWFDAFMNGLVSPEIYQGKKKD